MLDTFFFCVVLGSTGRIQETDLFQWLPDIPDKETGDGPEHTIEEVCLMTVSQIKIFSALSML